MKKHLLLLLPAFAGSILISGCVGPSLGTDIVVGGPAYLSKPTEPRPADLDAQMPPHESWCYKTMGEETDCYSEPQATPPGRLVSVDPPSRYPLTAQAYQDALAKSRVKQQAGVPTPPPAPVVPAAPAQVQTGNSLDASGVMDPQGAMPPSVQPTPLLPVK